MLLPVWIPTPSVLDLAPGSAVVTRPAPEPTDPPGMLLGWFEGNLYGAGNLQRFADRAHHAADRMLASYPTVAVRAFRPSELQMVGHLDTDTGEVGLVPGMQEPLAQWLALAIDQLQPELLTTSARHAAQRELRSLDPVTREFLRRHGPAPYRDVEH